MANRYKIAHENNVSTIINGKDAKTTPHNDDVVGLVDSEASSVLKKLSWTNIKATLKTYFDTLYSTAVKATGAELDTGTNDTKFATAKALSDQTVLLKKSGGTMTGALETADHGTASTDQVVNVCYGTGDPPTASDTTEGTIFIKYTA
jgi:hypothetical protein